MKATVVLMLLFSLASTIKTKNHQIVNTRNTDYSMVFLFPEESNSSYVRLTPSKALNLRAFTLCMRVSTELKGEREIILFAYRTQYYDELNIWRELDGRFSLYMSSSSSAMFTLPPLSAFPTHLCVTWDSRTGATAFWMNGRRSMLKIYRPGHEVRPNGAILLGQDPDSYLTDFESKQSFVGEITDVHMWDSILTASQIKQLSENQYQGPHGDVLDWDSLQYKTAGDVVEVLAPEV